MTPVQRRVAVASRRQIQVYRAAVGDREVAGAFHDVASFLKATGARRQHAETTTDINYRLVTMSAPGCVFWRRQGSPAWEQMST